MEWKDIEVLTELEARSIVKKYLEVHDFTVKELDPSILAEGIKSPDYEVYKDGNLVFYCEVKTPEHKLSEETGIYNWDTTFFKLREHIRKASKQFESRDKEHQIPRVVIFTSNHPQLNWTNFYHNIIAVVAYNGQVIRDFGGLPFLPKSNERLKSIDLIIWMQINYINRQTIYQMKHFLNAESPVLDEVKSISELLVPKPEEKIQA